MKLTFSTNKPMKTIPTMQYILTNCMWDYTGHQPALG